MYFRPSFIYLRIFTPYISLYTKYSLWVIFDIYTKSLIHISHYFKITFTCGSNNHNTHTLLHTNQLTITTSHNKIQHRFRIHQLLYSNLRHFHWIHQQPQAFTNICYSVPTKSAPPKLIRIITGTSAIARVNYYSKTNHARIYTFIYIYIFHILLFPQLPSQSIQLTHLHYSLYYVPTSTQNTRCVKLPIVIQVHSV